MDDAQPELADVSSGELAKRLASELVPRSGRPPYLVVASVVDDIANGVTALTAESANASEGFRAGVEAAARYVRDRAAALRDLAARPEQPLPPSL
jgi:hypothetical protein